MKAHQSNDICYSTLNNGANPFNFDGKERKVLTIEEAASAVDFEILKKPSFDEEGRRIPRHYHLVKDTDNTFVPSCGIGEKFTAIQHRDVFKKVVEEVMPQFPEMKLETAGTIYGGGIGLFTFRVGDLFNIKGDKSPNELRLFISNPCNGSGSLVMGFTHVRLFCHNQIAAAKMEARKDGWHIQHSKNGYELVGSAVKDVAYQISAAKELKARCDFLASIPVSRAALDACLDRIYPFGKLKEGTAGYTRMLKMREAVVEQFESGKTAQEMEGQKTGWTLLNSFTYPVFHPDKMGERTDEANIAYDGMVWGKSQRVNRMLDLVQSVVA